MAVRVAHHVRFEPLIDATRGLTGPPDEIAQSLAFPLDRVFSADGATLYVAGFGSEVVGVFDEAHDRRYVMHRFGQSIGIVGDLSEQKQRAMTASVFLRRTLRAFAGAEPGRRDV